MQKIVDNTHSNYVIINRYFFFDTEKTT